MQRGLLTSLRFDPLVFLFLFPLCPFLVEKLLTTCFRTRGHHSQHAKDKNEMPALQRREDILTC